MNPGKIKVKGRFVDFGISEIHSRHIIVKNYMK